MLQLTIFRKINSTEQEENSEILFQQDGASPHFTHEVRNSQKVRFS
jgi:hypothetical protein